MDETQQQEQSEVESVTRISPAKTEEEQPHADRNFPSLIGLQPVINVEIVNTCSDSQLDDLQSSLKSQRQNVESQSISKSPSQSQQDVGSQSELQSPKTLKPPQDSSDSQPQLQSHSWTQDLPNLNASEQHVRQVSVVMPQASPASPAVGSPFLTTESLSSMTDKNRASNVGRDIEMLTLPRTTGSLEVTFPSLGASISQSFSNVNDIGSNISKVSSPSGTTEIAYSIESTPSFPILVSHLSTDGTCDLAGSELVELDPKVVDQLVPQDVGDVPQKLGGKEAASQTSSRADVVHSSTTTINNNNSCISKWQRHETLKLIELYKENRQYFEDQHYKKKTVWSLLAAKLAKVSKSKVRYTGTQVSNRWKNLSKMYRDCIQGVPWITKCQYFDQLHSVFSDSKVLATSQSLKQRHQARSQRRKARQASANSGFVTIAPKKTARQVSTLRAGTMDSTSFITVSDRTVPVLHAMSDNKSKCLADVVSAVREVHEEQKKRDAWKLERLEKMHKEKMQLFTQFLDLLKEHKQ